jgi:transposase
VGYNFIACDRDQQFLMPPSLDDWLPRNHLARFIVDVVETLDLTRFYARRRADGWGRACYDPKMMVALLIYAWATGTRSSRVIERRGVEDIPCRFITANHHPDHATIARFIRDHEAELIDLFHQTVKLAAELGLVRVGVVALDSTTISANASSGANRTPDSIRAEIEEIVRQARATDEEEDSVHGDRRGDEIPEDLVESNDRLARLLAAKARIDSHHEQRQAEYEAGLAADQERFERTGKRPVGRRRKPLDERWDANRHSNKANTTDPDSRVVATGSGGFTQGYKVQAVTTSEQITIACGVTFANNDYDQLAPMVRRAQQNLEAAHLERGIGVVVADAGYYTDKNLMLEDELGVELIVATTKRRHTLAPSHPPRGRIPGHLTPRQKMERKVRTKRGKRLYKKRACSVEPVFGQQRQRGAGRFRRRGFRACDSELHFENAVHNLMKIRSSKKWTRRGPGGRDGDSLAARLKALCCRCDRRRERNF